MFEWASYYTEQTNRLHSPKYIPLHVTYSLEAAVSIENREKDFMPFWEFTPQKFTSKVAINFSFLLTEILLIKIPYVDLTGNKELLQEKRRPKT